MKVVLGIRFSSWNPAFQLEKRIPGQSPEKGGRDKGCLGDPLFRRLALFELECRIPQENLPQDNLHHGPPFQETGRGSAFRAGMPDSSSKSGSPRQPSSRRPSSVIRSLPTRKRFSPQDPLSQWSRPFSAIGRGLGFKSRRNNNLDSGLGSSFRAGNSSSKSGSPRQPSSPLFELNLHHGPPFQEIGRGSAFLSWNAGFQLEKRIPGQSPEKGGRDEGCLGDPLFELESGIPARKADPRPIS